MMKLKKYLGQRFSAIMDYFCGLPKKSQVVHSVHEALHASDIQKAIREMSNIKDATVEIYRFPENAPSWFRREHAFQSEHVFRLANVEVCAESGLIRLKCKKKRFLAESCGYYPNMKTAPFYMPISASVIHDQFACLVKPVGYYHFLLESLPQFLHAVKKYPIVPFMTYHAYPFITEIMNYLIETKTIKHAPQTLKSRIAHFDDYVFTSVSDWSGFVNLCDIRLIKEVVQPLSRQGKAGAKRFFVSRRYASRAFVNQQEIEAELRRQGIETVYLERMLLADQIRLFEDAELIVANHGAGLANIIWCEKKPMVVELFSPLQLNDCFARLSVSLGFEYKWVVAQGNEWGVLESSELNRLVKTT